MSFDRFPGWFVEVNEQWPGTALAMEVIEILHDEKSDYQHVVVFKSKAYGNVLVLDGVIQATELDEIAYHEPIAHIPLFSHPNPKTALIVGGGDGGVIREILRHKSIESVVICEIDQMVIDCAKKYLPVIASKWDDAKVTLICGDASEYIKREENKGKFDIIVADTSDPVGPAAALFESPFYVDIAAALAPGGRASTQGESMWKDVSLISRLISGVKSLNIFESVEYATTQIPTYPLGQIGFIVCAKASEEGPKENASCATPIREIPADMELQFYSAEMHKAAFTLPPFLNKAINGELVAKQISNINE